MLEVEGEEHPAKREQRRYYSLLVIPLSGTNRELKCKQFYEPSSNYIVCPIFHPKFFGGKGCNVLIRLQPSIREEIDYGTKKFKEIYKSRTSVERVFSRLLSITMQNPTVRGINAISNHATIAHIAVLLVALTVQRTGQNDKIRFVKSFVPNFLSEYMKN